MAPAWGKGQEVIAGRFVFGDASAAAYGQWFAARAIIFALRVSVRLRERKGDGTPILA